MINGKSVLEFMEEQENEAKHLISLHEIRDTFKHKSRNITKRIQKQIDEWISENTLVHKSCSNCRYENEFPAYHCGKRCGNDLKGWKPEYSLCDDWMDDIAENNPSILI